MSKNFAEQLLQLEKILGHTFTNVFWIESAVTHPSMNLHVPDLPNYERLEFLGDRVLGLVVADMLIERFPDEAEGALARRHAGLVCGTTLVEIATSIGLGQFLLLGDGEVKNDGRNNASNVENLCEAIIGALFKDGGFAVARSFIERYWQDKMESVITPPRDPKTALQEWGQGEGLPLPRYKEISREGAAHSPMFVVEVSVGEEHKATAEAPSKKKAEKMAATALLKTLRVKL